VARQRASHSKTSNKKPPKSAEPSHRNRVIERRRMDVAELAANPRNWRLHPQGQRAALEGLLGEIGQVGELYAYRSERAGGALVLIDGHLRGEIGGEWDVAITDLTDAEADKLLLAYDPVAALAEVDRDKLDGLLREVQTGSEALAAMFDDLAKLNGLVPGEEKGAADTSPQLGGLQYRVIVECAGEQQQAELLERLEKEGYKCQPLMS
jgi:hypothetical protein